MNNSEPWVVDDFHDAYEFIRTTGSYLVYMGEKYGHDEFAGAGGGLTMALACIYKAETGTWASPDQLAELEL